MTDKKFRLLKGNGDETKAVKSELGEESITRADLFSVQETLSVRIDATHMRSASISQILVEKGICSYQDITIKEKEMVEAMRIVRESMVAAFNNTDTISNVDELDNFVHKRAVNKGVKKDILMHIFEIKPM